MQLVRLTGLTLTATCLALSAHAGTVTTNGNTVCTGYTTVDVSATGNVAISGCTTGASASTGANFAVSAATTAVVNSPITVSVTRTVAGGGTPGADVLTLSSSLAGTSFNPATISFTAAQGSGSVTATSSATFSGAGNAVVSLSGYGSNTASSSGTITVSPATTGSCAGITPFEILNAAPYPQLGTTAYSVNTILADQGGYATGSVAFTPTANYPGNNKYWYISFNELPGAMRTAVYTAISTCPGDMQSLGMTGTLCKNAEANNDGSGVLFSTKSDTNWCKLTPGVTYYINMKSKNPATGVGYIFGIQ